MEEYCTRIREMTRELVRGISESLGLEECCLEKAADLESSSILFAANLYPSCPQPELARGLPSHSDQCLLTILLQNQIAGLQILHHHKWLNVNPIPNSLLVNVADQLEVHTPTCIIPFGLHFSNLPRQTLGYASSKLLDFKKFYFRFEL